MRGQYRAKFADVDGLQALQAADVLTVRRRIAKRSRPPQIRIPDMPLTDQEKKKYINVLFTITMEASVQAYSFALAPVFCENEKLWIYLRNINQTKEDTALWIQKKRLFWTQ